MVAPLAMRAAMTGGAIVEVANAFLHMLRSDAIGLMLVAAIASVFAEIIVHMTGSAGRIVIPV